MSINKSDPDLGIFDEIKDEWIEDDEEEAAEEGEI
jgi:hypothetical protein